MRDAENKIVFSKEIDESINGFALVVTFITIDIFLLFNSKYFGNAVVSIIVQWIFIIIGIVGLFTEIPKLKKTKENKLKGIDTITAGVILFLAWLFIYIRFNNWISNFLSFGLLILGTFGSIKGFFDFLYSIFKLRKENKQIITREIMKDILVMFSQIASIILIAVQILQAFNIVE